MRRTDFQPLALTASHAHGTKPANASGHLMWLEGGTAPPLFGDFRDEHSASWESAWIDLGGEG